MGTGAAQVERTVRGVLPDLGRLPISLDLRAISIAEGIRAALSVAVIIALREYLDIPEMSEAALASLLTCLCDAGGPIRRRVPALLSFTLIGAAVTASFGMMRVFGMGVALPLGILALFCTSFARIYGQSPQQVGALLSTVVILALDRPMAPAQAGVLAAFFLLGGVWATLLTMVIWQVHPYGPARRGVAEAYRRLSLLTADLRSLLLAAPGDAVWEAHARDHRGGVREAIEAARGIVMETLRTRGAASARAEQSLIRLETADQIFNALIALSDLTEHAGSRERAAVEPLLRRLRPLLAAMGRAIVTDTPQNVPQIGRSIDALAAAAAALPEGDRVEVDRVRAIFDRIVERLRIAQTLAAPENFLSDAGAPGQRPPLWQRVRQPLVANLTWGSPALRHALRTAAVAGEALALTMLWYSPYGHWLTITICATLQPYYALTLTRAVERVGGTALGGLGAGLVGLVCTTPLATALAMFPLAVLALSVRAVNHGLFMVMLTPLIVLLVDVGTSDASEWTVATVRAGLTLLGGVAAVASTFLLWPTWEPERLWNGLRAAIGAHGRYAEAELDCLLGVSTASAVERARRAAGVATNALEATISRALLEPVGVAHDELQAATVIDAALRRFAGRLSAMLLDPRLRAGVPAEALRGWRDWIGGAMRTLAEGRTDLPPRPSLPGTESLARIVRQVELMAGTLPRVSG